MWPLLYRTHVTDKEFILIGLFKIILILPIVLFGVFLLSSKTLRSKVSLSAAFSFKGRISRSTYWAMGWCVYSIYVIYGLVFGSLAIGIGTVLGEEALAIIDTIFNNFGILGSLLLLWSSFALAVKRLHDRDNPAWWLLIGFVPEAVLRTVIESLYQINTPQILRGTISLGVVALIWVVLGCLKGNRGPNRFGPDPLKTENTHFKGD